MGTTVFEADVDLTQRSLTFTLPTANILETDSDHQSWGNFLHQVLLPLAMGQLRCRSLVFRPGGVDSRFCTAVLRECTYNLGCNATYYADGTAAVFRQGAAPEFARSLRVMLQCIGQDAPATRAREDLRHPNRPRADDVKVPHPLPRIDDAEAPAMDKFYLYELQQARLYQLWDDYFHAKAHLDILRESWHIAEGPRGLAYVCETDENRLELYMSYRRWLSCMFQAHPPTNFDTVWLFTFTDDVPSPDQRAAIQEFVERHKQQFLVYCVRGFRTKYRFNFAYTSLFRLQHFATLLNR